MRELKFRAWDGSKMIDLKKITPLILTDPDMNGVFIPDIEHLKIMQYTGLKDKNGVEIYENDVVVFSYFSYDFTKDESVLKSGKGKIGYSNLYACFTIEPNIDNINNWIQFKGFSDDGEFIEVIGNIHQNKELL